MLIEAVLVHKRELSADEYISSNHSADSDTVQDGGKMSGGRGGTPCRQAFDDFEGQRDSVHVPASAPCGGILASDKLLSEAACLSAPPSPVHGFYQFTMILDHAYLHMHTRALTHPVESKTSVAGTIDDLGASGCC